MIEDTPETKPAAEKFDYSSYPADTLFHERRDEADRRQKFGVSAKFEDDGRSQVPKERRVKKERRRRIDPTTFEKQYTDDELEFMNAMQQYKVRMCKSFPTHLEVLEVALSLGYRKVVPATIAEKQDDRKPDGPAEPVDLSLAHQDAVSV